MDNDGNVDDSSPLDMVPSLTPLNVIIEDSGVLSATSSFERLFLVPLSPVLDVGNEGAWLKEVIPGPLIEVDTPTARMRMGTTEKKSTWNFNRSGKASFMSVATPVVAAGQSL